MAPQLQTAMQSIVNNIVEGAGRWTQKDQKHFYRIARASTYESAGCVYSAVKHRAIEPEIADEILGLLSRVGRMLTVMCR